MPGRAPVTIVDVGYRSTHFWVVSAGRSRLLFDLGWPGSMGLMRSNLERMGIPLGEIRYGLASHYHIDHAGLAEELKRLGIPLLVLETQRAAIPGMKQFTKPHDHFTDIGLDDNVDLTFAESRALLASIGLAGQILPTPGHSDDSVSLVLDDGSAFTGDLAAPARGGRDDDLSRARPGLSACAGQREVVGESSFSSTDSADSHRFFSQ